MKGIITLLFIIIVFMANATPRKDSILPVQFHIAPQYITDNQGLNLHLYLTKNRIVYGLTLNTKSKFVAKSGYSSLYDGMNSIYLMSGMDIRVDKHLSFSFLAGAGYVYYNKIELLHFTPAHTINTFFGPIYQPSSYEYQKAVKHLLGVKLTPSLNLHIKKRWAIQACLNTDLNKYMKDFEFALGMKWNFNV